MAQVNCKANGVNYSFQTRTLNWREQDALAARIVADPSKRCSERMRRGLDALDDPKPERKKVRRYVRSK